MKSTESRRVDIPATRKAGQSLRLKLRYIRDRIQEHAEVDPLGIVFEWLAAQVDRLKRTRLKHQHSPPSTANPMPTTAENEIISN
jgi:hypothetical protein